jgi:hypothetical protein
MKDEVGDSVERMKDEGGRRIENRDPQSSEPNRLLEIHHIQPLFKKDRPIAGGNLAVGDEE